ncbi:MAG: SpoIID/LytB domain-containing protein [Planctomycetota bacterium]|nr:SpoIID/LytB domain-containing protein [Planctomycetota bacterium]
MSCGDETPSAIKPQSETMGDPIPVESGPLLILPGDEPVVRVRLESRRSGGEPVTIGQEGVVLEVADGTGSAERINGPIHISRHDEHWVIDTAQGGVRVRRTGDRLRFRCSDPVVVGSGEHRFAGELHCVASSDTWHLIEHIQMEEYIPGVLAGELYAGWSFSCYAAQAVAARSFACMEVQMRTRSDWDVVASPTSQAYVGVTDNRTAHEAQAMTQGMVLAWNNQLVPGYYSSCCGGLAAIAVNQISSSPVNNVPPLEGHDGRDPCTNSPLYDWTIDRSARSLHRRLDAWSKHRSNHTLGRLTSIESITVHERNRHGRPMVLRITDRGGRSAKLTLQEFLEATGFEGSGSPRTRPKSLWSGWATGTVHRGRVQMQGHGFGHGVGLCQYGAQELGSNGKSFREILAWYYPGSELHKGW